MDRSKARRNFHQNSLGRISTDLRNASDLRQRLTDEIQDTIVEIDREISQLQISTSHRDRWPKAKKRVYQVIPRIEPQRKRYIGRYHYGSEVSEIEISADKEAYVEQSVHVGKFDVDYRQKIQSTEKLFRPVSSISTNRIQIFVPQYVEHIQLTETQSFEQISPSTVQFTEVPVDENFPEDHTVEIIDLSSLIQTAPSVSTVESIIVVKPMKHKFVSGKSSPNPVTTMEKNEKYFFSDFTENEEDLIVIDPQNFSPIVPDDESVQSQQTNSSDQLENRTNSSLTNKKQTETKNDEMTNEQFEISMESIKHTSDRSSIPVPLKSPDNLQEFPILSTNELFQRQNSISSVEHSLLDGSQQLSQSNSPEVPTITASQQRSKLSLIVHSRPVSSKLNQQPLPSITNTTRRVFFCTEPEENPKPSLSWRERINSILSKKRSSKDKYHYVKSRVNSFANFEYRPKRIIQLKINTSKPTKKAPKERQSFSFGRIQYTPNGTPKIFHCPLKINAQSKLKTYSLENLNYNSEREKLKASVQWHSEVKLNDLIVETPLPAILVQTVLLPILPEIESQEKKIFDIQTSSHPSSKKSNVEKRLLWTKKSKLKDLIWQNINYARRRSKTSNATHKSLDDLTNLPPMIALSNDTKDRYWSESDLQNVKKKRSVLSHYELPNWHDINLPSFDGHEISPPLAASDDQISKQSPAHRPKWNTVSKNRSVNSVYNPLVNNTNEIRHGWGFELRKKRQHKLPPLKQKPIEPEVSFAPLAVEYYPEQTNNNDNITISSRLSSRPFLPSRRMHDHQHFIETPRSQRPIQQEWYDEFNKTQLQNNDGRQSNFSNTPRDPLTIRSSTRNSQYSNASNRFLDSSIRTNRATELRLSRDLEEHHQHSHTTQQSMPLEIRGYQLEGTSLTVPEDATIRPLSNINYRASERVRNHRIYPWSTLHSVSISSRNSGLLPIEELRNSPSEMKSIQVPPLLLEE